MWMTWRFLRAIRLRHLSPNDRREANIGGRGFANNAPTLSTNKGSLLRGGGLCAGEKRNSIFTCAPEESGGLQFGAENWKNVQSRCPFCTKILLWYWGLVIAKCSHIFDRNEDTFDGKCSLQDVLKPGLWLSPEIFRRFWCVSELKPKDFLDILIGFGPSAAEVRKARFLWNLYRWASQQSKEFQHLPRSNEAMVSILADAHMLGPAESLLFSLVDRMAPAVSSELFSQIIQAYTEARNLEKSVALYDYARRKHLIPSVSCYEVLLHFLTRNRKDELILRVYLDMLKVAFGFCWVSTLAYPQLVWDLKALLVVGCWLLKLHLVLAPKEIFLIMFSCL